MKIPSKIHFFSKSSSFIQSFVDENMAPLNRLNGWYMVCIFMFSLFMTPFSSVIAKTSPINDIGNPTGYTKVFENTAINQDTFYGQSILFIGNLTVVGHVLIINSYCTFYTKSNSSSLAVIRIGYDSSLEFLNSEINVLQTNSTLSFNHKVTIKSLEQSQLLIIDTSLNIIPTIFGDYSGKTDNFEPTLSFTINSTKASKITIINSTITQLNPFNYTISIFQTKHVSLINNTLQHANKFLYLDSLEDVLIQGNNFSSFSDCLTIHNSNVNISQNNFKDGSDLFIIKQYDSSNMFTSTYNSFANISTIILPQFMVDSKTSLFYFNHNFYYSFQSIDFNQDGFFDSPYIDPYFIDDSPLSRPFTSKFFSNLNFYQTQSLEGKNLLLIGLYWEILLFFYGSIISQPLILLILFSKHNVKK